MSSFICLSLSLADELLLSFSVFHLVHLCHLLYLSLVLFLGSLDILSLHNRLQYQSCLGFSSAALRLHLLPASLSWSMPVNWIVLLQCSDPAAADRLCELIHHLSCLCIDHGFRNVHLCVRDGLLAIAASSLASFVCCLFLAPRAFLRTSALYSSRVSNSETSCREIIVQMSGSSFALISFTVTLEHCRLCQPDPLHDTQQGTVTFTSTSAPFSAPMS